MFGIVLQFNVEIKTCLNGNGTKYFGNFFGVLLCFLLHGFGLLFVARFQFGRHPIQKTQNIVTIVDAGYFLRGPSVNVRVENVCAEIDQKSDDAHVTLSGCQMQCGVAVQVSFVRISPVVIGDIFRDQVKNKK